MNEMQKQEDPVRRIVIAGGGNIGFSLAQRLEKEHQVKLIERDQRRARRISEQLNNTIVLSGVVRPQDISTDNTVKSAFVADAEVRIEGRGVVSDRQRPGLIMRILDFFALF